MRVLLEKKTGRIIEAQEGNDKKQLGVLLKNAVSCGFTKSEVEAKVVPDAEFQNMLKSQVEGDMTYADKRRAAYPSVAEQLDLLWHAINSGNPIDKSSEFFTSIAAVKERFPKP